MLIPSLQLYFKVDVLDSDLVKPEHIAAEVIGPSGPVYFDFDFNRDSDGGRSGSGGGTGKGYFRPDEYGMHEVVVTNEGEPVKGAPHFLRAMPKSKKDYDGEAERDYVFLVYYLYSI